MHVTSRVSAGSEACTISMTRVRCHFIYVWFGVGSILRQDPLLTSSPYPENRGQPQELGTKSPWPSALLLPLVSLSTAFGV